MSAKILRGKDCADKILLKVKERLENLKAKFSIVPGLAVILVGENPASLVYVRNKEKKAQELGVYSKVVRLSASVPKEELLYTIRELNEDKSIHGILLQLPLPPHLAPFEEEFLESISPLKDVDGFHPLNFGKLALNRPVFIPCTPKGVMRLLDMHDFSLAGKRAVVVGRSNIVGKPLVHLLVAKNATVTLCHSFTKDLELLTKEADFLFVAVGKPHFITKDMVKKDAVVIDIGINRTRDNKLAGDVDFDDVLDIAGAITPVPGGVGVLTIAMLMENTVEAAEFFASKNN